MNKLTFIPQLQKRVSYDNNADRPLLRGRQVIIIRYPDNSIITIILIPIPIRFPLVTFIYKIPIINARNIIRHSK